MILHYWIKFTIDGFFPEICVRGRHGFRIRSRLILSEKYHHEIFTERLFLASSLASSWFVFNIFCFSYRSSRSTCLNCGGNRIFLFMSAFRILLILTRKYVFNKWSVPWFHDCIDMDVWYIWFDYQKPISTTVVCITNEYSIHGFRSNRDLFRRWHCDFCQAPPHFEVFVRRYITFPKFIRRFASYLMRYFVEDTVCGEQRFPPQILG